MKMNSLTLYMHLNSSIKRLGAYKIFELQGWMPAYSNGSQVNSKKMEDNR